MKRCTTCGRIYINPKDFLHNTSRWRMCSDQNLYFNCSCGSTMVLPHGKYEWYSPTLFMSMQAASVFNTFADQTSLPYLPAVAVALMDKLQRESTPMSELVTICRMDPLLSAQLITTANAARSPGSVAVTTIDQAIGLLGRSRVSSLCHLAALSLFELRTESYTKQVHFQEAFTTGFAAEHLATLLVPQLSPETAYICGAFCNIGKLLGALVFPQATDSLYSCTMRLSHPLRWTEAERECGEVRHTILGEIAAVLWGMSKDVFGVVQNHHDALGTRPEAPQAALTHDLLALVTFANQVSHLVLLNSHRVDPELLAHGLSYFHLSKERLDSIVTSLKPLAEQSRSCLIGI